MVQHISSDLVKVAGQSIDRTTLTGLKTASLKSGVSFQYLVAKAAQESSLKTDAEASTSSATGLFQFTRGTWLDMMKRYGALYGYGDMAQKISVTDDGKASVKDAATEQRILALRGNPEASALMAAEYARGNAETMSGSLGRTVDAPDLYLAHFLGASGASQLLNAAADEPSKSAASVLPAAAKANQAVFYTPEGRARTAAEVVELVRERFSNQMDRYAGVATAMAEQDTVRAVSTERAILNTNAGKGMDVRGSTARDPEKMMVSQYILQEMAKMISQAPMNMMDGFEDEEDSSKDETALSSNALQGNDWSAALSGAYNKGGLSMLDRMTPDSGSAKARAGEATRTYDMLNAVPFVPVPPPRRNDPT
jgi:hypothetical protein